MAFDPRWKLPQGKTPEALYDCLFSLIRELRTGSYLPTPVSDAADITYDKLTGTIDYVRLLASASTITGGTIRLYGKP